MQRSKFGANARAEQIAQGCTCARREKIAALLSHYAEIEKENARLESRFIAAIRALNLELATANEHREAVTEKLEAAQMHNYRQNERIAKMQAVLGTTHVTLTSIRDTARLYPCCDQSTLDDLEQKCDEAITAIQHAALDALPSSTEDTNDALSV